MNLFEKYLTNKKKNNEKIKVYLNATQNVPSRDGKDVKINNIMLSGKVADVDSTSLELEGQECLIPFHSILDIKPDRY